MRRFRPTTLRLLFPALILLLLLPSASFASVPGERFTDRGALADLIGEAPDQPWAPEADGCGCLRELRSCLLAATLNLGRCVASLPVGDALCYLKYELDILICIQQLDVCAATCIP